MKELFSMIITALILITSIPLYTQSVADQKQKNKNEINKVKNINKKNKSSIFKPIIKKPKEEIIERTTTEKKTTTRIIRRNDTSEENNNNKINNKIIINNVINNTINEKDKNKSKEIDKKIATVIKKKPLYDYDDYEKKLYNFQIVPIFTKKKFVSQFSIHLFGGYSTVVKGISVGCGVDFIGEDLHGAQASGIGNIIGQDMNGFQSAGIFNIIGRNANGFSGAGIFNIVNGKARGGFGAGIFNIAEKGGDGFFGAGIFNIVNGKTSGFIASGIFNITGNLDGFTTSLLNISKNVKGAQVGLLNIGKKVDGCQIGLINISEKVNGIPIGLISIMTKGRTHVDFTYNDSGVIDFNIKNGNDFFYTLYSLSTDQELGTFSAGYGYGLHFKIWALYIDIDASARAIYSRENIFQEIPLLHAQARATLGIQIAPRFAIFAGISYNYATNFGRSNVPMPASRYVNYKFNWSSENHKHWPGFYIGVQF